MSIKHYQKEPVIIEAVQWTGLNLEEIKEFVGKRLIYQISDAAWEVGKGGAARSYADLHSRRNSPCHCQ